MRKTLVDAVALLDLPSWEHVGAELLSHGITDGQREHCELCPIARFLQLTTNRKRVSVTVSTTYTAGIILHPIPLPPAAVEFIRWFDDFGRA